MELRNIGIFAHVDAGKTTLSERILVHSGVIRQAGSVDDGTAHTDNLPVEQRRGISVKATCVSFVWKNVHFNLIDTPGHTDFSAEIERSLWALDGAVLLIDAVEGVQPQTEVLFSVLTQQRIPIVIFINKTDREGADVASVLCQLQKLSKEIVCPTDMESLTECVCSADDDLMERYLNGDSISSDLLFAKFRDLARSGQAFPVYSGSALRDIGITEFMDALVAYLPPPSSANDELCGIVFACVIDRVMGRGLLVRLFGGRLENRMLINISRGYDFLTGQEKVDSRKITQIRDVSGNDLGVLEAGMVGIVYGLGDVDIGHVFGDKARLPRKMEAGSLRAPLINVQVKPEKPEDMRALRTACETLSAEDPMLQARYIRTLDQLQISVMGTVQLEILEELLQTRFGLKASFGEPTVIYKETIRKAARGFIDYTMPKPCWAILEFQIEPAPRGSGVTFESKVPVKDILARYQHQVEQAIPLSLRQGRLGWEVTDVKITLTGGNSHLEHTHPLDFIVATPMGIQNGLANGGSVLLEPILEARFLLPPDCIGRVISDVNTMRGEVLETASSGDRVTLTALIPVSSSLNYSTTLAMETGGRGIMNVRLHGYRDCPLELGATAPRRSTDPLDTAKYILVIRNALEGSLFDDE
ncbi:MAG: TetM/TetW/TetO/TetS family tetracycline resistance ribosomal protection protein [Victivallales bacterium]|nr:TetM/TetW/TetO/TetS family tetracycline resistance ribosomal protection protein [Victivallales bacterium]